jgi:hypothetical protein
VADDRRADDDGCHAAKQGAGELRAFFQHDLAREVYDALSDWIGLAFGQLNNLAQASLSCE